MFFGKAYSHGQRVDAKEMPFGLGVKERPCCGWPDRLWDAVG